MALDEDMALLARQPLLSLMDFHAVCAQWNVQIATPKTLSRLSDEQRKRSVILVQDAFTRYFETPLAAQWIELIARLGYQVYLAPFSPKRDDSLRLAIEMTRSGDPGPDTDANDPDEYFNWLIGQS